MNDSKKTSKSQIVGSIYLIYCVITDKFYVGQTIQKVSRRMYEHKCCKKSILGQEIQRLGWKGNFDYFILEENLPLELLNERERYWIKIFDCVYPNGYNMTHGGTGSTIVSDETKAKIRANLVIKKGETHPQYGTHLSEERKAYLSKINSGENNAFHGKHHTEEQRAKWSEMRRGKST